MTPKPNSTASRVAVVFNPVKVDEDELKQVVRRRADRHGWTDLRFLSTTEADPGAGVTERAVTEGVGLVVAVGGDGTVREVATGLGSSGTPLGIVPRGTGNLLARNLDIPLDDLDAAVGVAMGGRTRPVDLGEVEYIDDAGTRHREKFLVMLGAGMDADMIAGTDSKLKARVGWAAYVGSFATTLLRGHRIRVEFAVDGSDRIHSHTRTLLVANCGTLQGGMILLPDAKIDDGLLDVLAVRPKGPLGWAPAGYVVLIEHTFLRRLTRLRDAAKNARARSTGFEYIADPLQFRQGREMTATVLEKPAPFQIDGEDIGSVSEFTARIRHRGLNVRVRLH